MTFEEAKKYLSKLHRYELQDHAFGDRELTWSDEAPPDGSAVLAEGAAGGFEAVLDIYVSSEIRESLPEDDPGVLQTFKGKEALELMECGLTVTISRNDTTGPDEYQDGVCMPALTLGGVRDEVTRRK